MGNKPATPNQWNKQRTRKQQQLKQTGKQHNRHKRKQRAMEPRKATRMKTEWGSNVANAKPWHKHWTHMNTTTTKTEWNRMGNKIKTRKHETNNEIHPIEQTIKQNEKQHNKNKPWNNNAKPMHEQ